MCVRWPVPLSVSGALPEVLPSTTSLALPLEMVTRSDLKGGAHDTSAQDACPCLVSLSSLFPFFSPPVPSLVFPPAHRQPFNGLRYTLHFCVLWKMYVVGHA